MPQTDSPAAETTSISAPTFGEAFSYWVRLGFINFGGPAGQIAIMHRELVDQRRWVSEGLFLRALNFAAMLPGPEAQQMAIYFGWRVPRDSRRRHRGLIFRHSLDLRHARVELYGRSWRRDPAHRWAPLRSSDGCDRDRGRGRIGASGNGRSAIHCSTRSPRPRSSRSIFSICLSQGGRDRRWSARGAAVSFLAGSIPAAAQHGSSGAVLHGRGLEGRRFHQSSKTNRTK